MRFCWALGVGVALGLMAAGPAFSCENTGSFDRFKAEMRAEAKAGGVSEATLRRALDPLTFDPGIVRKDRRQAFFAQDFYTFANRLVSADRLRRGPGQIAKYRAVFDRVQREQGVPAAVITAFWGLESDFGINMGKDDSLRSIATLAYDCRRPELFRPQLIAALKIIERGDLDPAEMIGSWAGELGQTQFLAVHYLNHATDYDGDGKANLIKSAPDVIGSTAKLLRFKGWRPNEPWLQEVRVPSDLDWRQADIAITHAESQWAAWGVRKADGSPLANGGRAASLILPMGRKGPAFLGYANYQVFLEWNESLVYATTAAYFASRLAGAGPMRQPQSEGVGYGHEATLRVQRLLSRAGYDVGKVDGKIGTKTRAAIRAAQIKYRLPADAYPSAELERALGG